MHYVKTTTSYHSDSPLPTSGPSLSENRPAGHRPKSWALTTTSTAPDEQQRPLQPEFRPYGRGGAGRRPRVKPNKSELDPKDQPKFPIFKFPAKWRPKVPASEQASPASPSPGFYDGPWCGPSRSAPSLPSPSSLRTPSPMFTQRDLFLASLWKKNSKKTRASNADSLSVTCSTSSTFSGHSSSASGSSLASLSRPESDDSVSEVYTESFEIPSSASHSPEVTVCRSDTGAGSESTGLEGGLSTTEITVVGMGDDCDVLDAMRKLRMK
ncbi:hypothetical protein EDD18DRAFT_285191 [Armillaria luteobubalina]|uniref:Uncharacterized protein n=1 Tax=Armillaria luteobubalina TaxID=153913 RepID=A0AA39Q235_9AGAR|nr:hypothetical protein EDD18DRAFT_285191 [Armillaria luteobubalina]